MSIWSHIIAFWLVVTGTCFMFPSIGNVVIKNWLIFFRGVAQPPTSCCSWPGFHITEALWDSRADWGSLPRAPPTVGLRGPTGNSRPHRKPKHGNLADPACNTCLGRSWLQQWHDGAVFWLHYFPIQQIKWEKVAKTYRGVDFKLEVSPPGP